MLPLLPETAPFSSGQRAWLNGFFAGVFGFTPANGNGQGSGGHSAPPPTAPSPPAPPAVEEEFPWHDPALPIRERLTLAEGRPFDRVLMAATAQLDCGACGYVCQSYSEAIALGEEKDLTKCSPGGKETSKKLKELLAGRKALPTVEPSHNGHANGKAHAPAIAAPKAGQFDRKNPFHAPLLACEQLTLPGSAKDVRRVAFSLKGSGLTYEVGDALGVCPENDPELVEAVIARMGARGDEMVPTPDGGRAHLYDALTRHFALTRVSDDFAALMAAAAAVPSERGTLTTLVEDDRDGVLASWDVLDLLEQFPSARPPAAEVVAALAPLAPRLYSISSSLAAHPEEVHLTVGVVRYSNGDRLRKGVASNFLTETLRVRQKAGVFVHRSPGFRLPVAGDAPVIMVGPGTGIAPFRAFLQERAAAGAAGRNWLFFGDQRRATDFLYRPELEAFAASGVLSRLDLAFSRDQEEKTYVQHRMRESGRELWAWLEAGAHLYVCGDARRMALDVDHALHAIVAEQGGNSADEARAYVKAMTKANRYQRDVY